jgi:hypothetical protein
MHPLRAAEVEEIKAQILFCIAADATLFSLLTDISS